MPRYPVRQPDGKIAIFSTIVDEFVDGDLTDEEALCELGGRCTCRADAEAAMKRMDEHPERWAERLATIKAVHGDDYVPEILRPAPAARRTT